MNDEQIFALYKAHILDRIALIARPQFALYEQVVIAGIREIVKEVQQPKCICGGEPHVSHCPANPDPFLKVNV